MSKKPLKEIRANHVDLEINRLNRESPGKGSVAVMERLAYRVQLKFPNSVIKGGVAIQLHANTLRTTRDIDFIISGDETRINRDIEEAISIETTPHDHITFRIIKSEPIKNDGIQYSGQRFDIQATASKPKKPIARFSLEVTTGKVLPGECIEIESNRLDNIFPPTRLRIYPIEKQLAEKIHAYTDPQELDRYRDLVDICLLAQCYNCDSQKLYLAIQHTFQSRPSRHKFIEELTGPREDWNRTHFEKLASVLPGNMRLIEQAHAAAKKFIDPVLNSSPLPKSSWNASSWSWRVISSTD